MRCLKWFQLLTVLSSFLFFFQPVEAPGQSKGKPGFELGFDLLPYATQIKNDNPDFQKDWEVFFKSRMEKGEFRVKLGHYNQPIHERQMFKFVQVTDECEDPTAYKNFQDPEDFYFLNLGYGRKQSTPWFDIILGADVNLSHYNGQTIVRKEYCTIVVDGEQFGGESLYKLLEKSNYLGIGVTPFVGIKIPVMERFRLTFETGLQFNYLLGDYTYLIADKSTEAFPISEFEINWGKLSSDIAISYIF